MESGGERMLPVPVAITSECGAAAVMTKNAPGSVKSWPRKSLAPAAIFPPGEAGTISLAPSATWASEDAIVKNTAQAKEPPTTIRESET